MSNYRVGRGMKEGWRRRKPTRDGKMEKRREGENLGMGAEGPNCDIMLRRHFSLTIEHFGATWSMRGEGNVAAWGRHDQSST